MYHKLPYEILNFNIHVLEENLKFYQKMSLFLFFNYILIMIVRLSLYLWKSPQKSANYTVFLWISKILSDIRYAKFFRFIQKYFYFLFQLYYYLFVCLPLWLWKLLQKSSHFTVFLWISIILSDICYANFFRFIRKYLHFLFQL